MCESNPVRCPIKKTFGSDYHCTHDYCFNKLHSDSVGRKLELMLRPSHWRKKTKSGAVVSWIRIHQNAAFYSVGKFFCLSGGQEHRCLKISQIQGGDSKYIYHENLLKKEAVSSIMSVPQQKRTARKTSLSSVYAINLQGCTINSFKLLSSTKQPN